MWLENKNLSFLIHKTYFLTCFSFKTPLRHTRNHNKSIFYPKISFNQFKIKKSNQTKIHISSSTFLAWLHGKIISIKFFICNINLLTLNSIFCDKNMATSTIYLFAIPILKSLYLFWEVYLFYFIIE